MNKEDLKKVLPLFEGAVETGQIKKKSFVNWVVITLIIFSHSFKSSFPNVLFQNKHSVYLEFVLVSR